MAFTISVQNAKRVRSYQACVNLFMEPPNLRRAGWGEDRRPLDGWRKSHMRVERGPSGEYFDVVLYSTPMARFFRPEPGGSSYVWYTPHGSQSSKAFMWHVLGLNTTGNYRLTTDKRKVLVGMRPRANDFPVRLHIVDGRLDVSGSQDSPELDRTSTSPERVRQRKEFKAWLRPYQAMGAVIEDERVITNYHRVAGICRKAYTEQMEFDPTELSVYIKRNGVQSLVDALYPLGDVDHYNPSFKDVTT